MVTQFSDRVSILVVEDEDELRQIMVSRLRKKNYYVLEANNITSAFGQVNNHRFDLLIFDLRLKNDSGVDLIKYVRKNQNSKNHRSPILVVSGNIDQDAVRNLQGLISDAIVKPFEKSDFLEKVGALAGIPPERPEESEPEAEPVEPANVQTKIEKTDEPEKK